MCGDRAFADAALARADYDAVRWRVDQFQGIVEHRNRPPCVPQIRVRTGAATASWHTGIRPWSGIKGGLPNWGVHSTAQFPQGFGQRAVDAGRVTYSRLAIPAACRWSPVQAAEGLMRGYVRRCVWPCAVGLLVASCPVSLEVRGSTKSSVSIFRVRGASCPGPRGGCGLQQGPAVDLHHPPYLWLPPACQRHVEQSSDGAGFVKVQGGTPDVSHVSRAQGSPARDIPARALGEDDAQWAASASRLWVQRQGLAAGPAAVHHAVAVAERPQVQARVGNKPTGTLRMTGHGAEGTRPDPNVRSGGQTSMRRRGRSSNFGEIGQGPMRQDTSACHCAARAGSRAGGYYGVILGVLSEISAGRARSGLRWLELSGTWFLNPSPAGLGICCRDQ